jgi:flagellar assembly protein FliH
MTWSRDPSAWIERAAVPTVVAEWPTPRLDGSSAGAPVALAATPEEEAYARGLLDGAAQARAELQDELLGSLQALGGATQSLQAVQAALAAEMEESLCTLSLAIAQRIIQREVTLDPNALLEMVRRAVGVLPPEPTLEIRLNPEDLIALEGNLDLHAAGGRAIDVQWVGDPELDRGGYVIESPQRVADGRLDLTLARILHRLRDV